MTALPATPAQPTTADELAALPGDGTLHELSQGRLVCMSPSSWTASRVAGRAGSRLGIYVEGHTLGEYGVSEGGFLLSTNPDTVRAPDVWFVCAARIPTEGIPEGFWPGPPDLAIEVLSPSDRFINVMRKVEE